jgi:hypothetical protein
MKTRLVAAAPALVLGWGMFLWCSAAYARYWLLRDALRATALITVEGSHNTVYYTYRVAGTQYSGHSQRDAHDERHGKVGPGGSAPVWYSSSHPWLSSLPESRPTLYGLPWILLASPVESLFVITMIAPGSAWALNFEPRGETEGPEKGQGLEIV